MGATPMITMMTAVLLIAILMGMVIHARARARGPEWENGRAGGGSGETESPCTRSPNTSPAHILHTPWAG
eukprot:6718759-Lingulodinium_polyedra.AAC.1